MTHEHTVVNGWTLLTAHSCPEAGTVIYSIWCDNAAPARAIGESNTLYIGQGDAARLRLLLNEKHHALVRLQEFNAISDAMLQPKLTYSCWFKTADNPAGDVLTDSEIAEIGLLNDFLRKHGELPLLNRKHEGWAAGKVLKALAQRLTGADPTILDGHTAGWSMVWGTANHGGDFVLAWLWPASWLAGEFDSPKHRGDLLLIRPGTGGEELPAVLNPSHPKWNQHVRVTASCPASALAGASAGQSNDAMRDLWKALSGSAGTLDGLEAAMNARRRGGVATQQE